jgi:hypothetical protein
MLALKASVQAGLVLATVFGIPAVMVVVCGGLRFWPILLLPIFAYWLIRWQCRLALTIQAAMREWNRTASYRLTNSPDDRPAALPTL